MSPVAFGRQSRGRRSPNDFLFERKGKPAKTSSPKRGTVLYLGRNARPGSSSWLRGERHATQLVK